MIDERSKYIVGLFEKYIPKDLSILEIGCGNRRHVNSLLEVGYKNVEGIDKLEGTAIEDVEPKKYDVIYTASCLYLIPKENEWVFDKIAKMVKNYLIIIEGEVNGENIIGRDYSKIFEKLGFKQIEHTKDVFNATGHSRVFIKNNGN